MKRLIHLVLLAFLLTSPISNYGQPNPHQDSIKISLDDYKFIREWAEFGLFADSALALKDSQIVALNGIIEARNSQLLLTEAAIREKDAMITKLNRQKRFGKALVFSLFTGVLIETVVLIAVLN